ncbi:MAG: dihydrofolate reductase [Bacteroidetes bacterium]|nr:MAG: dihydrofolate reductase [Bacteroidota bacterium]
MRKLIVSMNLSLDGFMSGSHAELDWHFQHWSSEMAEHLSQQLTSADTILLGSHTYEAMAKYWPYKLADLNFPREDISYADMMNNYQKVVFANKKLKTEWNNSTVIRGDIGKKVEGLKKQEGKDIIVYGSGTLIESLLPKGLVDEFQLWVHPVLLGQGRAFFVSLDHRVKLKLVDTRRFDSGVVVLKYEVDRLSM